MLQLASVLLLLPSLFAAVLNVAFYVACLTTYYMFMLRFWVIFQGRLAITINVYWMTSLRLQIGQLFHNRLLIQ